LEKLAAIINRIVRWAPAVALLYWIYRKRILRQVALLKLFADLLERRGIPYWVDYGTLLGAYRNARIIPWDDDIDLSIMASDHDRVLSLNALLPDRYVIGISQHLQQAYEDGTEFLRLRDGRRGPYVDLYHYKKTPNHLLQDLSLSFDGKGDYENLPVEADLIFPLDKILLEGRLFPCPHRVEDYLRTRYRTLQPQVLSYRVPGERVRVSPRKSSPESR
jgi:phosphorylcholine metabolism protein LicD